VVDPKPFLTSIFEAAVAAADPERTIREHLPKPPKGRTIVIGAGKGAAQMAAAFEKVWEGPLEGLVVTRYGYSAPTQRIEVIEAAHPVPDKAGLEAGQRLLRQVEGLSADDLVVALVCGGGSALLPAPAGSLTLEDEIAVNEALLASGAPISVMNAIRKHVSAIKGGRLAARAHPARVVSLIVSDIPGDNPALVASGPTVPDAASRADALKAIEAYGIELPQAVMAHLNSPEADAPHPDDDRFRRRVAGGRRSGSEKAGYRGCHPVRFHRGRGARGGVGPCGHRPRDRHPQPALLKARSAAVRRGDHGDAARQRQGRPQQRIPALLRSGHRRL
jgi:hydroxypyruvate reductase